MKKFALISFAALLVFAFTAPAMAVEHEFGGYWRTRFYTEQNFTGEDETEAKDFSWVDTRTRLYYTAVLNDNLKFVNKFEIDAVWGTGPLGDIGADGVSVEVKNSYADFNMGSINAKVGIQGGAALGRGFIFDDDFSGAKITFNGEGFSIPFTWYKPYEGGIGLDANDQDFDYYALTPTFSLGENLTLNPFYVLAMSDDASAFGGFDRLGGDAATWLNDAHDISDLVDGLNEVIADAIEAGVASDFLEDYFDLADGDLAFLDGVAGLEIAASFDLAVAAADTNLNYLGLNLDWAFDGGSVWFTGIYEFGDVDLSVSASGSLSETLSVALDGVALPDHPEFDVEISQTLEQDVAIDLDYVENVDVKAWLVALGGNLNLGAADLHGQFFYATGQEDDEDDITAFIGLKGQSYYWAEIMGYGTFDYDVSNGSPADQISNIMAFNLGASFSPMDKLTLGADLWYAALVEDNADGEDKLGTELDLSASYELIEGLNLDIVAAYLFADDATEASADEADPWELGAQLSLSF